MFQNRLGCKWSEFRMGSEFWKPNHLKSGQMATILSKTIWNPDTCVQITNGLKLKPDHLETGPFESDLQNVLISYVSRFQMVGFQIPTIDHRAIITSREHLTLRFFDLWSHSKLLDASDIFRRELQLQEPSEYWTSPVFIWWKLISLQMASEYQ